jgi:hypothetical protein
MPFTLGLTTLLTIIFYLLFAVHGTATRQERRGGVFCLASIATLTFASSTLFPWYKIANIVPPVGFFTKILQFPWRLNNLTVLLAAWLLCLLAGKLTQARQKYVIMGIVCVGLLQALEFNSKPLIEIPNMFVSERGDSMIIVQGEYLPAGADIADYVNSLTPGERADIHDTWRKYNRITVSLTNNSNNSDFIEVPLINYPGYRAVDLNTGTRLAVSDGASKRVKVEIPSGYFGTFTVHVVSPWYWRVAEIISAATVIGLAVWWWRRRRIPPLDFHDRE